MYAAAPTRIYFTNFLNPPAAPATQTSSGGSYSVSALSGWTNYSFANQPGSFGASSSSGNVQLNFSSPLVLQSCGASNGSIVLTWGHTSANKACNVSINGGAAALVATATVSKALRVDSYAIPSGTTSISSLKFVSSGSSGLTLFSVEVLTCVDQPTIVTSSTSLSGFTYAQGLGPSATQSFSISGTTLTPGDLTVQAPADYEVSLSATAGFASSLTIPVATASLSSTTVYTRLVSGLSQSATPFSGNITISGCAATAQTVSLTGTVTAPTIPTLVPDPLSLSALNYSIGNGPSASQIINVSGALLDGSPVTARVTSSNFEVSLSPTTGFAQNITLTNSVGTLTSTPVYVRLKSGITTVSPFSDTFYLEGGGASTHKLNISGAVLASPLIAPSVGIPTLATEDGFTANWTAVPSATGYIVNVYNATGSTFIKSVNVSAQATNSSVINGLAGSTDYTYRVIAVGDGTAYSNSVESTLSQPITTLLAAVLVTPPCAITRYQTEFTDWDDVVSSSSSMFAIAQNGGAGFSILKAEVKPAISVASNLGVFNITSTGGFTSKPIDFLGGGNLIVEVVTSSNRTLTLTEKNSGAAGIVGTYEAQAMPAATISGNAATLVSGAGIYKINFALAAGTFTGTKTLSLMTNGGGVSILNVTICSGAGATPVLTTYPMPEVTRVLSAPIGGNTFAEAIQVHGYNLAGDVTLSIEGPDRGYFSLPLTSVAAATVQNGKNVGVVYKSSVSPKIHSALLKIESPGADPVYVKLTGISTPVATMPQILADTSTIAFWGSPISSTTKTLQLAGLNLTDNVTVSLTGASSSKFSVSPLVIQKQTALNGTALNITYTGDINFPTTDVAMLELKSTGAPTVYVPLKGYTLDSRPELLELKFVISPNGSGVVSATPVGTMYLKGTTVAASVIPETGYSISYWDDAAGNHSSNRSFRVTDRKQGVITVFLVKNDDGGAVLPSSSYVAFAPDESNNQLTGTGFLARWASLNDSDEATNPVSKYTVVIYDENGVELSRTDTGLTNTYLVTGLTPGAFYSYSVIATKVDATTKITPRVGLLQTTPTVIPFSCGE